MQVLVVALIVLAAAAYAAWQLMPRRMRRWLVGRLRTVAPSRGGWLARLVAEAENGACGSCKGCATKAEALAPPGHAKVDVRRLRVTGIVRRH